MRNPDTYIEFTKSLIDEINAFHTRGAITPNYFTMNMGGIHFYDSIVVVEKFNRQFQPNAFKIGKPSF